MTKRKRNYVVRSDGKPINVPRQRGQLFICELGCCCGHTDRGFAPVPHDLYYEEWSRRKLRNKVHLNHGGCLGPCALANVAMLLFDGRPIWFHSLNSESLILAIYDYIDAMLAADHYLPPPTELVNHVFNGFAWDGSESAPQRLNDSGESTIQQKAESPSHQIADSSESLNRRIARIAESSILFLSHADTDLLTLGRVTADLPDDFPTVRGVNLSSLPTEAHVESFIQNELAEVQVIVLRSLGGRQGFMHGFDQLVQFARQNQRDLICVPGTEGLDPELTAHSSVPVSVIHDVYRYLHFGGVANLRQMVHFLADHLLAGGWGYDQPVEQPRHGIYDFGFTNDDLSSSATVNRQSQIVNHKSPVVAILFYRSHYLSGNTAFIDGLIDEIERHGARALPIFTTSLKETVEDTEATANDEPTANRQSKIVNPKSPAAFQFLYDKQGTLLPDVVISTMSFAMGGINREGTTLPGWNVSALETLGVPILQAVSSSMRLEEWQISQRGLRPLDVAMNVALPEFDGRIITVPISFKGETSPHPPAPSPTGRKGESPLSTQYLPVPDRVEALVKLSLRHANLRHKPNRDKRVAFMLTNSPGKADRIGNAVGLDTPASLMRLFDRMQAGGYQLNDMPPDGDTLLHTLIDLCSYDETLLTESQLVQAAGRVSVENYLHWFNQLPESQQRRMNERWQDAPGEAYVHVDYDGKSQHIALAGLELGNVFVALQPPRGYGMDPDAIYHTPDLPPTHNYYALYKWLNTSQAEGGWGADAIVHMGKHGTLEWLPGKGIGLSAECFPDSFLADMPLIYPFIINNPGEGTQAKRRAHATIIDHMIPPMTSADVYGELATLTQLVDEYYQVEQMDPSKLPLVQQQIWQLMQQTNLDQDIAEMMRFIDHGDHTHEWDGEYTDDGTPLTLAEMSGTEFAHLLEDIDGYLCELGSLQIRDGLHTLGFVPEGDQLCHLIRALTRIPNGDIPSLRAEVATALGFDLDTLLADRGARLSSSDPKGFGEATPFHSNADLLDHIDQLCLDLIQTLAEHDFDPKVIEATISQNLPNTQHEIRNTLHFVCTTLVPLIQQNGAEIENVLQALNGAYIPAGPAGAPTRGMAHILPTGRNFYAVDPQAIPSQAAWRVGQQLADELIARYQQEEGAYPESVGLSIWGTSAMRTHGDDIAQCFALLGVRPVWQAESRRLTGIEVIPLEELGRPRVDVLMQISGFFRDAFPHLIELMDNAAQQVATLDEPQEQNFVRKHFLRDVADLMADLPGCTNCDSGCCSPTDTALETKELERQASYRVFGSKPGSYGAGILPLIHEQNWQNEADFAQAYINWGGYAYGEKIYGADARSAFKTTLSGVQVAVKNQDNREHDIFDSDDYLQYHGGMIATIRSLNGRNPKSYFGDNSDPARAEVRTLQQESYRVFRSRVNNPKWIESIQRHGYKGALELAATVDYLFGYDATAQVVDDWMYEQTAQSYALSAEMQAFFKQSNPWALKSISERLLEAAQRGMWAEPDPDLLAQLQAVYLDVEGDLEGRGT